MHKFKLGMTSMSGAMPFEAFWGPVTSTIDWCEPNYMYSPFVAEPLNTFSNLSFVIFGLIGALHEYRQNSKTSFILMHGTISLIGLGSMAFHGTLSLLGQQLDELPMVYYLLFSLWQINHEKFAAPQRRRNFIVGGLFGYAAIFSVVHIALKMTTAFQVHFVALIGVAVMQMHYRFRTIPLEEEAYKIVRGFFGFGLSAGAMWMIDYHFCPYFTSEECVFNPHGHVWWHLLMGYCAYYSVVMIKVLDDSEKQKPYFVKYDNIFRLPMVFRQQSTLANDDVEAGISLIQSSADSSDNKEDHSTTDQRSRCASEQISIPSSRTDNNNSRSRTKSESI